MSKSIFYRLFGIGKIPANISAELQQEGILVLDEGIPSTVTYTNFRAPRRRYGLRRIWFSGSIALTRTRILALNGSNSVINVPLTDERLHSMRFSVQGNGAVLTVALDASLFHADWSGGIEYGFRTPHAQELIDLLGQQIR